MPVKQTKKGCYKYGNSGKEYCGAGAKAKATRQGVAIKVSQNKQKSK